MVVYTIGPKGIRNELLRRNHPIEKHHGGQIYKDRDEAERVLADNGDQVRLYCPGIGFVFVEGDVYGVVAKLKDLELVDKEFVEWRLRVSCPIVPLLEGI